MQSDQRLHCLPFCTHFLDALQYDSITLFKFKDMSHVMRKSVFAICKQQRCRSACASGISIIFHVAKWLLLPASDNGFVCSNFIEMKLVSETKLCFIAHDDHLQSPFRLPDITEIKLERT